MLSFLSVGMEGERPARLNRGEADRDAYRRSAAPRKYTSAILVTVMNIQICPPLWNASYVMHSSTTTTEHSLNNKHIELIAELLYWISLDWTVHLIKWPVTISYQCFWAEIEMLYIFKFPYVKWQDLLFVYVTVNWIPFGFYKVLMAN